MSEVRELTHSLSARGRPLIGDSEEASAIAEAIGCRWRLRAAAARR